MIIQTNIELAQVSLIGVGIIFTTLGSFIYVSRSSLTPNISHIVEPSPLPDSKKLTPHQREVLDVMSYRPVPVISKPSIVSRRIKVEESAATAKLNNLKDTVRMKIAEAYISSKRLLAAIRREIFADHGRKQIQFNFAGVIVGPFSENEVRRYVEEGYLLPCDLAKCEVDSEWSTLQHVLDGQDAQQIELTMSNAKEATNSKPLKPARYQKQVRVPIVPRIVPTDSRGNLIYNT